jgi:hypothetical protein
MSENKGFGLISIGLAGGLGGLLGGVMADARANTEPRIAQIQLHNAEVYQLLEPTYGGLGRLVLNDETDTFEFHVMSGDGQSQICQGEYEVTDGAARVTGDIACTTTTKVGGN